MSSKSVCLKTFAKCDRIFSVLDVRHWCGGFALGSVVFFKNLVIIDT